MIAKPDLVVTPSILGEDGISCLARQVVKALCEIHSGRAIEVWSWTDGDRHSPGAAPSGARLRALERSYLRLAEWVTRECWSLQRGRFLFVLHVHLAPAVLPLVARGATLVPFLLGIEVWKPLSKLQRAALHRGAPLIGISQYTITEFKRANPDFADKEAKLCHPGLPDGIETYPSAGACQFALIVGRMAANERYKGHDSLLEIWGEVLRRAPGVRLVVVGDGDDRSRLQAKAESLGLKEEVRFTGQVSVQVRESLYQQSCFMVPPSRGEGFGFVFLEAMRQAKPAIASRGASSEIVESGETGFVVDPDDRPALMEAIVRLFQEEELRKRMGERARTRFQEHFTTECFRNRLQAILGARG